MAGGVSKYYARAWVHEPDGTRWVPRCAACAVRMHPLLCVQCVYVCALCASMCLYVVGIHSTGAGACPLRALSHATCMRTCMRPAGLRERQESKHATFSLAAHIRAASVDAAPWHGVRAHLLAHHARGHAARAPACASTSRAGWVR